jgi:hypothetical protein
MTTAPNAQTLHTAALAGAEGEDGVLLRLLALALDKVQRRRRHPKKPGKLHRV